MHQRRASVSQRSSSASQRRAWERYGGALALTIVVVLGRLALDPVWGLLAEAGHPVVVHAGHAPVAAAHTGPEPIAALLTWALQI